MAFWADALKFIRSKVFKDELKNGDYSVSQAEKDSEGNKISDSYLKRWGGIMTGKMYFWSDALPEFEKSNSPEFILGAGSFEELDESGLAGGRPLKAIKPEDVKAGGLTNDWITPLNWSSIELSAGLYVFEFTEIADNIEAYKGTFTFVLNVGEGDESISNNVTFKTMENNSLYYSLAYLIYNPNSSTLSFARAPIKDYEYNAKNCEFVVRYKKII